MPVVPRLISNLSRFLTGIEIHPGATDRRGAVHRPRHGRRHRRDGGDRRRLPHLPGRHAGRHEHCTARSATRRSGDGVDRRRRREAHRRRRDRRQRAHRRRLRRRDERAARTPPSSACPATSSRSTRPAATRLRGCRTRSGTASTRSNSTSSAWSGASGRCRSSSRRSAAGAAAGSRAASRHCIATSDGRRTRAMRSRKKGDRRLIRFTNTLTRQLETFEPQGDPVTMYVCGITPYDESPHRPRHELHRLRRRDALPALARATPSSTSRTSPTSTTASSTAPTG